MKKNAVSYDEALPDDVAARLREIEPSVIEGIHDATLLSWSRGEDEEGRELVTLATKQGFVFARFTPTELLNLDADVISRRILEADVKRQSQTGSVGSGLPMVLIGLAVGALGIAGAGAHPATLLIFGGTGVALFIAGVIRMSKSDD